MIRSIEMKRFAARALVMLVCLLAVCAAVRADEGASLLQAVPPDVHFVAHTRRSKTPDPASVRMQKAWKLLVESGVHRDLIDLCVLDLPQGPREMIVGKIDQALALLSKVDWALLGSDESLFTFKMGIPLPEYLMLFRVPKDRMASQLAGMKEMLSGFAAMLPMASVRDVQLAPGNTTILSVQGFPMQLVFSGVGDVLIISTSSQLASSAMTRLSNGGEGSLAKNERFQASLKSLPAPTEGVSFVDVDGLLGFMSQAMSLAQMGMQGGGDGNAIALDMIHLITVVLGEFNRVDQVISTVASDGTSTTATTLVQMLPSYSGSKLSKVFAEQKPWDAWQKRVPADATGFSFDSGLDPTALYDLLLSCVKEGLRDPSGLLGKWDGIQAQWGVNVRDVLSAFSGECAVIEFPQAGPDGCAVGEAVCLLRLEKPDVVAEQVKRLLDAAVAFVRGRGQKIEINSTGGLYRISIDAFPWIRPVVGVKGSDFVIATSPAALDKIDRVMAGKEPDIRTSPRFAALGAGKSDSTRHLEYAQVDATITPLVHLMSAYGFVFTMFPDDPELAAMRKIGSILTKVAPAIRELDMHFDQADETLPGTADTFVTRHVVRYR
ncbi:MAG: hypothetical protein HYR85_19520 [Planctomycetes bacterium]|nr:hypothetical protein [Planctomycetota bacterium]MBI3846755.1 hypothetical protein [Planctomycetota bacterium]